MKWFPKYNFILASKSPRRQQLLESLGIEFSVQTREVEEVYPDELSKENVPVFLAELKAQPFINDLKENDLVITADTVVCFQNEILGKPVDVSDAYGMLRKLSKGDHEVILECV